MKRIAYFVTLQIFSFTLFALELRVHDALNFFPKATGQTKSGSSVNGITWSEKDFYAVSTANEVYFARTKEYGGQSIQSPGGDITFIKFVNNPETQKDHLLITTENNVIGVKIFSDVEAEDTSTKTFDPELRINSVDFAPDGSKVLMGAENGEVHLMLLLKMSQELSDIIIATHSRGVSSVAFSPDYRYFLSAGKDGVINIWSTEKENKKFLTIEQKKRFPVPVKFSADSLYVVSAKSMDTLAFTDFAGNIVQEITVKGKILDYNFSSDAEFIFILNTYNNICIYDVKSGDYVGYVPPFNSTPIMQFAFNKKGDRLLVGHEDGTFYDLQTNEVILKPDAKAPNLGKGGVGVIGTRTVEVNVPNTPKEKATDEKKSKGKARSRDVNTGGLDMGYRGAHSIELRASVYPTTKPYILQGAVSLGYTNGSLISPFYFGGFIKGQMAFPSTDFPSKYYYQGKLLPNPLLDSFGLIVPIGFAVRPFGKGIELYGEFDLGGLLYTFQFPEYGFTGKFFASFNAEMCIGIAWKGISLFVGGGYDTRIGFVFDGGLGVRIEVGS